jgi:Mce-associated membrane protein
MLSRARPAKALNTDNTGVATVSSPASTSLAEAEELLAQAEAQAEAARARATRLRRQAIAASNDQSEPVGIAETDASQPRRLHRPRRKVIVAAAATVVTCVSLTLSGYVVWHHRGVVRERQRTAEFATAARNAVVMMMSIDASKARDDLQRFIDDTTGQFKAQMLVSAEDIVKAVQESKVSATTTVQAVAVESMAKDSAVALVAAKSEFTNSVTAKPQPRSWRVVIKLQRDGGQLKVSRVEFLP